MRRYNRLIAPLGLLTFLSTTLVTPITAYASEQGHKNTAIGLGAASALLLLTQRNKLPGILAGAGAAYAYSQSERDMAARHRRERWRAYHRGYNRGVRSARYHRRHRHHHHSA